MRPLGEMTVHLDRPMTPEPEPVPAAIHLIDGSIIEVVDAVAWSADDDFFQVQTTGNGHVVVPNRMVVHLTFGIERAE